MNLRTDPAPPQTAPDRSETEGSIWFLGAVCLVASLAGLLFGFDTAVISGTVERVKQQFALTEFLEGWFTSSALVGCIVGAAVAGTLGDRFGRKPVLIAAAVVFFVSGLYSAFPPSFSALITARILCGFGVGMASVIAPMYISEFAPPRWRGRLVAFYQLSIVMGILLAYLSNWLILRFAQTHPIGFGGMGLWHWLFVSEFWRGMFAAEILPAIVFFLLLLFVPESPRWLIKAGRQTQGRAVLARISGSLTAQEQLTEIQSGLTAQSGSVAELFRPGLRRALFVGVMLGVFGQLSGVNIVVYYGPKILTAAGYQDIGALLGQVGFGLINLVFTIIALLVIDAWGRRPLLIGGMAVVTAALAATGALFRYGVAESTLLAPATGAVSVSSTVGLWIGIMICLYMGCIALSICAVIWVLTPEIFPTRVRGRAASIATFANWATNAFSAFVFPWYAARFGMHAFFLTTAAICLIATGFFWRCVPETKGRTLEEIEKMWQPGSCTQPTV